MNKPTKLALLAAAVTATLAGAAQASIVITEVDPGGSGTTGLYAADWFELTNTGASAVNITGWKMDDNSNSFSLAVPLSLAGNSIAAGQTVVFAETSNLATTQTKFINTWFGGTAPAGFTMGSYSGSGVGLSTTGGDAVNIYDSAGGLQASVSFGVIPDTTKTLDNAQGLDNTAISLPSAVGVNGAFAGTDGRIGSPGVVPVPASAWLFGSALGLLGFRRRAA